MSKRYYQQITAQPQIIILVSTSSHALNKVWLAMLAALTAGIFYFFTFVFGDTLWRVLAGG